MTQTPIFAAIDTDDIQTAKDIASILLKKQIGLKIGLQFLSKHGPQGVKELISCCDETPSVFLDTKFHDIPNTVYGAVKSLSDLPLTYMNIHVSGGMHMIEKARQAAHENEQKILGVTVLTSMTDNDLKDLACGRAMKNQVVAMAKMAQEAGLDGVVCSGEEIASIRDACGDEFVLMVPGIRPSGSDVQDQKRVMTPKNAMNMGATHLVIGRPITQADNPASAIDEILESLKA